jgi:hypothetical protein
VTAVTLRRKMVSGSEGSFTISGTIDVMVFDAEGACKPQVSALRVHQTMRNRGSALNGLAGACAMRWCESSFVTIVPLCRLGPVASRHEVLRHRDE